MATDGSLNLEISGLRTMILPVGWFFKKCLAASFSDTRFH